MFLENSLQSLSDREKYRVESSLVTGDLYM